MRKLSVQAYNHNVLNELIFNLSLIILSEKFNSIPKIKIEEEDLKKGIWIASILCTSNEESHRRKGQLFSSLLFLNFKDNIEILKTCYILFSRLGNLTATKFLDGLYEQKEKNPINLRSKYEFGSFITNELIHERESRIIEASSNSYLITDFQKELWKALEKHSEISISAPTSSGKSFIIKQFILNQFSKTQSFRVLYIVPSRALINQVGEEFKAEIGNDVHIKTSYVEENEISDKEIYVLTPERCVKFLNSKLKVDFIFVDEIQGVADIFGRGLTFEYVYNEIPHCFPSAKLITAGPNIDYPEKTFKEIFEKESFSVITKLSPVFQFKIIMKILQNFQFEVELKTESGKSQKFIQDLGFDSSKTSTLGSTIANLVKHIAPNDFNIIFVQDGNLAQNWALKYAQITEDVNDLDEEVKELIDFLKEDIHKKYFLIECLQKKIAYHHGSLPDIVRKEIEELFASEKITNIFCTSTLLEGVNLPANNLFTMQPKKDSEPLNKFEFGNLIGRAGRLQSSLYGTVYYLEKENDKIKASDYFDAEYNKEIEIFSSYALNELDINDLKLPINLIEKETATSTSTAKQLSVFLRHKFLKGENHALKYLKSKKLSINQVDLAMSYLRDTLRSISVPIIVLNNNPSIDPILQNELYDKVVKSNIRDWVINKNSNYNEFLTSDEIINISYHNRPFYWQFVDLIERLDSIFSIIEESKVKYKNWVSARSMCYQSKKWLSGEPIGKIINSNINYLESRDKIDSNSIDDINSVINNTIKFNSTITTYLLPKYIKVLVDILNVVLSDSQKEEYKLTLSLPTMLELGTQEGAIIRLISSGISRNVAIKIFDVYKKETTKEFRETYDILEWLSSKKEINGLKPIYNRYLNRLKVLKND
ncbi:hypothetical protein FCR2A7T_13420 [Flavobacterium cauense R2A-7]|uniref:Helicase-like protein n=1 Tax=Flavobacterium cauense R2A-7 TaxID=1341154 RepID=V6RZN5_9FLAO|nr:DEAD/DEAH box helicase [Flavobacterium cauense]ESU19936.1 hypothetical protein FCR2A7T_13420 [Flavobacterium cauense R2A-7]KGO83742.1 hypothetical protein Q762_00390 [Flavobacterium cauense R2A-7]TWI12358.1 helicase-like protein [Flavobacterium cauense R2A-7]